jgi:hypothetical protein
MFIQLNFIEELNKYSHVDKERRAKSKQPLMRRLIATERRMNCHPQQSNQ